MAMVMTREQEADQQVAEPGAACGSCRSAARTRGEGRALWGWSPPDRAADTAMKRRIDRLLPRSGIACAAWFAVVIGLLSLAPHLSLRAGLAADGVAPLAGGARGGLHFWLCPDAPRPPTPTASPPLSLLPFPLPRPRHH